MAVLHDSSLQISDICIVILRYLFLPLACLFEMLDFMLLVSSLSFKLIHFFFFLHPSQKLLIIQSYWWSDFDTSTRLFLFITQFRYGCDLITPQSLSWQTSIAFRMVLFVAVLFGFRYKLLHGEGSLFINVVAGTGQPSLFQIFFVDISSVHAKLGTLSRSANRFTFLQVLCTRIIDDLLELTTIFRCTLEIIGHFG